MAALNSEQQYFIIQCFAAFKSPTEIVEAVKNEFGLTVSRQQVWNYSPENPAVAPKWKALFDERRASFIEKLDAHGISHKAYRIAELHDMARRARSSRNYPLAAQLMEQAAKEMGGLYTNKRELTGKDGAPLIPDVAPGVLDALKAGYDKISHEGGK